MRTKTPMFPQMHGAPSWTGIWSEVHVPLGHRHAGVAEVEPDGLHAYPSLGSHEAQVCRVVWKLTYSGSPTSRTKSSKRRER